MNSLEGRGSTSPSPGHEEGTPEEIIDRPKWENTRRFVRRLKVLELTVESRHYHFRERTARLRSNANS